MRLFLAINLSPDLKQKIRQIKQLENFKNNSIRLVDDRQSHLTLKFFGETGERQLKIIKEAINKVLAVQRQFKMSVGPLLLIPSSPNPRVIALAIRSKELNFLAKALNHEFKALNLEEMDSKPFLPHITLARIKANLKFEEVNGIINTPFDEMAVVEEINLFESKLTDRGPIHTVLEKFYLK